MKFCYTSLILLLLLSCQDATEQSTTTTLPEIDSKISLQSIPPSQSNVHFNNELKETPNLNIFIWNFLYSGAGVAAGDFNNDGLADLYFAGNASNDQLYLNEGDFVFKDITASAGIELRGWSTGVTMADVNADGWLDIYVCKNSPTAIPENNRNKLFINQKDGTFKEQGQEYGLADIGFGIQGSFFDLDNDGDLDFYLVNQPFDSYAKRVNSPQAVASMAATDRLFINEGGKFIEKTAAFNLTNAKYGLNVSLGDFNLDGWTDVYIPNDYDDADYFYINNNGRLVDELTKRTNHISRFAMGSDVVDINQDGHLDLYTLDMAFQSHLRSKTNMESMDPEKFWKEVESGEHYQYAQNNLQLNRGDGSFSEVAQVAGLAKSDWSWAPLFVDLDTDGKSDVLLSNGILRDMKNNDFREHLINKYDGKVTPANMQEALSKMPSTPIPNLAYQNKGDLKFEDISNEAGFNFSGFSHGTAYADFDLDGKMDVVVNNMNAPASIYKNTSKGAGNYISIALIGPKKNKQGLGCTVITYVGAHKQIACMQSTRGYLSASEAVLHFGWGAATELDSVKIIWNHNEMSTLKNVKLNQKIKYDYAGAKKTPFFLPKSPSILFTEIDLVKYQHQEKEFNDYAGQVLLPYKLSQNGPFITSGDVNEDGLDDLIIGGASGQIAQLHLQTEGGKFIKTIQPGLQVDYALENMSASLADLDGDKDLDLVFSNGSNELDEGDALLGPRAYENVGQGVFQKATNFSPEQIKTNGQCQVVFDADGDGDLDLFVGGRMISGQYPKPAASQLWLNDGKNKWTNATVKMAHFLSEIGLLTAATSSDIDGDGDQDLLLIGEWMAPTLLINNSNKGFEQKTITEAGIGLWWTLEKIDADGDGDDDFLLGNLGWNNKFGGAGKPTLEVYSDDFDKSGDNDVVLAVSKDGKTYPLRGRECSSQEMPFVLEKFPSFQAFGEAELADIIGSDQLEKSIHKKIGSLTSVLLKNEGQGNFSIQDLPLECQFGPIKAFAVDDFNQDGLPDFIFGGNHFPTEVETARYDGLGLGICLGNKNGGFSFTQPTFNKLPTAMDVRDIELMQIGEKKVAIVACNNQMLQCFSIQ